MKCILLLFTISLLMPTFINATPSHSVTVTVVKNREATGRRHEIQQNEELATTLRVGNSSYQITLSLLNIINHKATIQYYMRQISSHQRKQDLPNITQPLTSIVPTDQDSELAHSENDSAQLYVNVKNKPADNSCTLY